MRLVNIWEGECWQTKLGAQWTDNVSDWLQIWGSISVMAEWLYGSTCPSCLRQCTSLRSKEGMMLFREIMQNFSFTRTDWVLTNHVWVWDTPLLWGWGNTGSKIPCLLSAQGTSSTAPMARSDCTSGVSNCLWEMSPKGQGKVIGGWGRRELEKISNFHRAKNPVVSSDEGPMHSRSEIDD